MGLDPFQIVEALMAMDEEARTKLIANAAIEKLAPNASNEDRAWLEAMFLTVSRCGQAEANERVNGLLDGILRGTRH